VTIDVLRVEWTSISDATAAILVGPVDESAVPVIVAIRKVATEVPLVVIDLSRVTEIDQAGVVLLEGLSHISNVGVVNPSDVVVDALEKVGHLGF